MLSHLYRFIKLKVGLTSKNMTNNLLRIANLLSWIYVVMEAMHAALNKCGKYEHNQRTRCASTTMSVCLGLLPSISHLHALLPSISPACFVSRPTHSEPKTHVLHTLHDEDLQQHPTRVFGSPLVSLQLPLHVS